MLSQINEIIYPNRCEVVKIKDQDVYVYPIFKNGSSSILEYAKRNQYKILLNEQLKNLTSINVILRDPKSRYISGLKTFVYNTLKENPGLDKDTILYFAENYLFLNRHYSPQITWLINLNRYTGAKLKLHGMESLAEFTPWNLRPPEDLIFDDQLIEKLGNNVNNEIYLELDTMLLELIGQELSFADILKYIKKNPVAYSKLKCIAPD